MQNQQFPWSTQRPPQYQQNLQQQSRRGYQHNFTEAQMRHYFYKPSNTYRWLMLSGIVLGVFGILLAGILGSQAVYLIILGVGFFIWGGILFGMYSDRPTDEQYANWVAERSKALYETARQRLHIVDESECERIIEVQGAISSLLQHKQKFPEKEIILKRLSNGRRHYSINVCMYIFLLKDDIAIYSGYINALAQAERFEDADHYYYENIVAVSTSGPIYKSWARSSETEIQMQGFLVRANNGDAIGTDYATKIFLREKGGKRAEISIDEIVAALLSLIRSHKLSALEASKTSRDII
jgi:hypothetical protein